MAEHRGNVVRIKAIVRVVIDVKVDSVWGSDTTWDQIAKQAMTQAEGMIEKQSNSKARIVELVEVRCIPES